MKNTGNLPAKVDVGRRSPLWIGDCDPMEAHDWSVLASAYDTYHESGVSDPDVKAFCQDVFSSYGLWDESEDKPMLKVYKELFRTRC